MARTDRSRRLQGERRAAYERAAVDQWNSLYPVGVEVYYKDDFGKKTESKTRSEAQMLSGHTAVIWIEGKSGCVALERVTLRTVPINPADRNVTP